MKRSAKKIAVALLAATMVLGAVGCSNKPTAAPTGAGETSPAVTTQPSGPRTANVVIGTWWTQHYDSNDKDVSDSADWAVAQDKEGDSEAALEEHRINRESMEARFANVKKVEEKYGVKFYWQNLTYAGVQESINQSILAGSPDCDIYLVDAGMAIPAQMNNLCVDLKKVLPADHDFLNAQVVAKYLDLGDNRACIIQRQGGMVNNHALGFNKQLLEANNLEDPRVLWEKGEWDWDTFRDYCKKLTQDTDGDGEIDQFGFCAWDSDQFEEFMLSNGANIAQGTTQQLSSAKMNEVLQFVYDLHNVDKVCKEVDSTMDSNDVRTLYRNGNIGFFWIDVWVQEQGGSDYDWGQNGTAQLDFDVIYCHWPVGPSGDQDTDPQLNNVGGELYILPAGVEDPATVFGVLYDNWNWYEGDVSKRDNPATLNWWVNASGRTDENRLANFKVQQEILAKQTVDLWNSMGVQFDLWEIITGESTPTQWQETYKQAFQDALDAYFNK